MLVPALPEVLMLVVPRTVLVELALPMPMVVATAVPTSMVEVLALPIRTWPLVVVPLPPCKTKLPPTEVAPVWLEPRRVRDEPVPEPVVESPGAKVKALAVPALAVVMSLVWAPCRVMTPALETAKFGKVMVLEELPAIMLVPVEFPRLSAPVPLAAMLVVAEPELLMLVAPRTVVVELALPMATVPE